MKKFEQPEIEVQNFEVTDVITASCTADYVSCNNETPGDQL